MCVCLEYVCASLVWRKFNLKHSGSVLNVNRWGLSKSNWRKSVTCSSVKCFVLWCIWCVSRRQRCLPTWVCLNSNFWSKSVKPSGAKCVHAVYVHSISHLVSFGFFTISIFFSVTLTFSFFLSFNLLFPLSFVSKAVANAIAIHIKCTIIHLIVHLYK